MDRVIGMKRCETMKLSEKFDHIFLHIFLLSNIYVQSTGFPL